MLLEDQGKVQNGANADPTSCVRGFGESEEVASLVETRGGGFGEEVGEGHERAVVVRQGGNTVRELGRVASPLC